jgi:hypothetical protein
MLIRLHPAAWLFLSSACLISYPLVWLLPMPSVPAAALVRMHRFLATAWHGVHLAVPFVAFAGLNGACSSSVCVCLGLWDSVVYVPAQKPFAGLNGACNSSMCGGLWISIVCVPAQEHAMGFGFEAIMEFADVWCPLWAHMRCHMRSGSPGLSRMSCGVCCVCCALCLFPWQQSCHATMCLAQSLC